MKSSLSHFTGSFVFAAVAVPLAWFVAGPQAALTVAFLGVLETSLSFDNAVVNAAILRDWDGVWRRRFLTWGMIIAVFGMRLVFPVVIVAVAGGMGPLQAIDLAVNRPDEYGRVLTSVHHEVAGFGGAFLMMVFFKFFVARHKTEHWFEAIEKPLTRLGKLEAIEAALTLIAVLLVSGLLEGQERGEFVAAGAWGVVAFILVKGLAAVLGGSEEGTAHHAVRQGVGGFLYLEVLDASFSFDGVIGAFAMTNNLLIIVLGLGVGAMFVRSFTLLLVERGTLETYRYLEHGAFWAIGALAVMMFAGVAVHIPEAVTGLVGGALIVLSLGSSIRANRKAARAS